MTSKEDDDDESAQGVGAAPRSGRTSLGSPVRIGRGEYGEYLGRPVVGE